MQDRRSCSQVDHTANIDETGIEYYKYEILNRFEMLGICLSLTRKKTLE